MYRLFNSNARNAGSHHYTALVGERDYLVSVGWRNEKIAWYSVDLPALYYPSSSPRLPVRDTPMCTSKVPNGVGGYWVITAPCSGRV